MKTTIITKLATLAMFSTIFSASGITLAEYTAWGYRTSADSSTVTLTRSAAAWGRTGTGANDWYGVIAFDLSAYSVAELQAGEFTLSFDTVALADASGDLVLDYLGTYGASDVTTSVANGQLFQDATAVVNILDGAFTSGSQSFSAAIEGDDFTNDYAVFRLSDSTFTTNQVEEVTLGTATLVVPEPTSLAMLGLGGLALVTRRKR